MAIKRSIILFVYLGSPETSVYTLTEGVPVADPTTSLRLNTFGLGGLMLFQDTQLIETLAHFARERIPERLDFGGLLESAEAEKLAGSNPDHHKLDLFNAIECGEFPSWTASVQVLELKDAESFRWNIFDMTKIWPHTDVPSRPFGKMTLNKNPTNFFADIEQAAFSPSNMVPGIAPSADPVLQARLSSYPDAARYRLGTNYQQLKSNEPHCSVYAPYQRDGLSSINGNYGSDPNYVRSSFGPLAPVTCKVQTVHDIQHELWSGKLTVFTSEVVDDDFENLVRNVAGDLANVKGERVRREAIEIFRRVDEDLAIRIERKIAELSTQ
ncbi:hypothetical protein EYC80_003847 [Monilinia laxa]|uniref:Catalase core domain-containing protein n=1 Tax=Monilinia laxa TaxID=61186 RepID=A0A5N6KL81_MONLA|nr:hypothetical protein EYC80_003847 [Monilinia laxa]